MQAQNTEPEPTRQDLLDAYEAAQAAAEAVGWEYDLSMAAANAYDRLNRRMTANLPIDKI